MCCSVDSLCLPAERVWGREDEWHDLAGPRSVLVMSPDHRQGSRLWVQHTMEVEGSQSEQRAEWVRVAHPAWSEWKPTCHMTGGPRCALHSGGPQCWCFVFWCLSRLTSTCEHGSIVLNAIKAVCFNLIQLTNKSIRPQIIPACYYFSRSALVWVE